MDQEQALVEKIGEQLRAKIISKFQISAFLAGLLVAVVAALLATLGDTAKPPLFGMSIVLMFGALIVYAAALIKLDALTMPKRFWRDRPDERVMIYRNVLLKDNDLVLLRRDWRKTGGVGAS